jgi:hypothetical protein
LNKIKTVTGTINTLISKENLISSLIGGFIGTSIPIIGNITIDIIKASYNKKLLIDKNPIAYLFEINKKATSHNKR